MEHKGYFMALTMVTDVDPASCAAQDEIFGSVVCITPFNTDAEAVAMANGIEFGFEALYKYVRTKNVAISLKG